MSERYNNSTDGNDDPQAEKFRKLFIGGLNYETTEETLKQHFEQWGEIVDCFIKMNSETNKSRGFGFLTYKTAEMLDEAQKNRPHKLDDRELDTKRATPRDGNFESQSVKKMFIGGIKDDTTEDNIKEVFGQFGTIEKLEMIKDKNTGKQKGFCFLTFEDFDSVDKCVLKRRIPLDGKDVEVKKAVPKERDGMGSGRGGGRGGMRGRGSFGGANNGSYNNGYGYQGNMGYPGDMGNGGPNGYANGGPQDYWGGYQNGYNYNGFNNSGGNFNGDYNFGYGYGSGYNSGPTRGAGFQNRDAGPYGRGYGYRK